MSSSSVSLQLLHETGVELGEYADELQRLAEQFNLLKWKNADNVLQVVLKESVSIQCNPPLSHDTN